MLHLPNETRDIFVDCRTGRWRGPQQPSAEAACACGGVIRCAGSELSGIAPDTCFAWLRAPRSERRLDPIDRALHAQPSAIRDVRVDHRGTDVGVPEQLLDGADIVSGLEEMSRKRMAQGVAAHALRQLRPARRLGDRPLNRRFVQMKPRQWPESRIAADASRRKYELPAPLGRSVRKLLFERERQHNAAESVRQIGLMTGVDLLEVLAPPIAHEIRQDHATVVLLRGDN